MTIEKHEFSAEATTGTSREYGNMSLVESIMSGPLSDGRKVEILRCASGRPNFFIRIEGSDIEMRVNLYDTMIGLAEKLGEITSKPAEVIS